MAEKLRWGVMGSGGIAKRRTIPEGILAASNAQLAAVYDTDGAANRAVAEQFGARAASSAEDLLDGVDAVYIATPAYLHHRQALNCFRAGRHVLCEKPLGMSVAEAEEMDGAAARAGVVLGTGLMMRFQSQHREALRLIREGALGRMVYGRAQLSCWYPPIEGAWRQDAALGGGGSLIDMGGHCIDLLEMFCGPVVEVSCFVRNSVHGYAPEDSAVAMIAFESGALGTVDTFFCIPDAASRNRLELYGSCGGILAEGTIGQGSQGTMTATLEEAPSGYEAGQARAAGGGIAITPDPVNMYRAEIEDFGAAALGGRKPLADAAAGVRSQRVLAACYESARLGGWRRV